MTEHCLFNTTNKSHALIDIIVLTVCAVASGADGWETIEQFGKEKLEWLRKYVPLKSSVSSHDCIAYVLCRVSPPKFRECFMSWAQAVSKETGGVVIAIDGKTTKGSRDRKHNRSPLHMVSAWACHNRLVLGQEAIQEKSNGITATPKLLALLELKGCMVTLDAMDCQRAIAKQIIDQGGDYVLGLKGNQCALHKAVEDFLPKLKLISLGELYTIMWKRSKKIMAGSRHDGIGLQKSLVLCPIPSTGTAYAASVWCKATVCKRIRTQLNNVISSTPSPPRLSLLLTRCGNIGGSRIPCIGGWMSLLTMTPAVSANAMARR